MSTAEPTLDLLRSARLLAIVRSADEHVITAALEGLIAAGVRIAEISLSPPGTLPVLRRAAERFGDQLVLGAGTVRTVEQAEQALEAGARFTVAPSLHPGVVTFAAEAGVLHLPGVLTPTEVDRALALGAPALKLFPAGHVGPSYVTELLAPFPEARFVATGGVDPANAAAFLEAGAVALGVAGALVPASTPLIAEDVEARARGLLGSLPLPTTKDPHGH